MIRLFAPLFVCLHRSSATVCGVILYLLTPATLASEYIDASSTEASAAALSRLNRELDESFEIELALSAAPIHLRQGASVYVYKKIDGYVKVQRGENGFACLVNRDAFFYEGSNFKPTCWDRNGSESYVKLILLVGQLMASDLGAGEIRTRIDEIIRDGEISPPKSTGVAYMLAGDVTISLDRKNIESTTFAPHLMFYASGISTDDLGVSEADRSRNDTLPFVFDKGAGGSQFGYIITMIGKALP